MKRTLLILPLLFVLSCATTPPDGEDDEVGQKYWPAPPGEPRYEYVMSFFSSADFVRQTDDDRVREAILGKSKPDFILQRPLDVTGKRGVLYLIDSDSPVINVIDLVRRRFYKFGYRFEGKLAKPVGIALDNRGRVYVSDRGRNSVIVYDGMGLFQSLISLEGVTTQLAGLAVDAAGEHLYVVDRGGIDSQFHQVIKLTTDGKLVQRIGKRGKLPGEFNLPTDIAIDQDDRLYVLDSGNFRVQVLGESGGPIRAWGQAGNALGQFGLPRSIAIDSDDHVYVSDAQFGNVQVFDNAGKLLLPIGRLSQSKGQGLYSLITGVNVDSKNYLYVLDQFKGKMEVFKKLSPAERQRLLQRNEQRDASKN